MGEKKRNILIGSQKAKVMTTYASKKWGVALQD
jgi:hypothetical protein